MAPPTKTSRQKKSSSKPQQSAPTRGGLTPSQLLILAGLLMVAAIVWIGIGLAIYINQDQLFEPPASVNQIEPSPQNRLAPVQPTERPSPTSSLAPATPTPEPSPTATYAVAPAFINKEKIANIIKFVETRRGLSLPQALPINFLQRNQLQQQWKAEAIDSRVARMIENQELLHRALGLIQERANLAEAAAEFQTRSLMGYYRPDNKSMYIVADSVNMFADEEMTFAHEYVHALQDYYFDLSSLLRFDSSMDAILAARALPEGDAKLVEELFTAQNIGEDQLEYSAYRYLLQEPPALEGISPALSIATFFPYTAGEFFVLYLFFEGGFQWDRVNQAYQNPPISTEQVLHPEKYIAGEKPILVIVPDLSPALDASWQEIDQNILGELGLLIWLIDQVEPNLAINGAAGWDGDRYTLWLNENDQPLLGHVSIWDSEMEAREFFETATIGLNLRHGEAVYTETAERRWQSSTTATLLRQRGNQILLIITPDASLLEPVALRFNRF